MSQTKAFRIPLASRCLLWAAGSLFFLLVGCESGSSPTTPPDLNAAVTAYRAGQYEKAVGEFRNCRRAGVQRDSAEYFEGLCHLKLGNPKQAGARFRSVVKRSGNRSLRGRAALGEAKSLIAREQYDKASRALDELLGDSWKGAVDRAGVLNARADCHERAGNEDGALASRRMLAREFPKSLTGAGPHPKWAVQLLEHFGVQRNAAATLSKIKRAGFSQARIVRTIQLHHKSEGSMRFIIQIGEYTDRNQALKILQQVQAKSFKATIR